ncbi:protein JINGUBANG [Nymphaea colorata]|uniref:protein JINGUBANG n=1 Tax=Nymphaea colorata TaxID=210225 RepID=UPI00129DCE03|nr:protein JINGUBANG [Nymphaea colorata]
MRCFANASLSTSPSRRSLLEEEADVSSSDDSVLSHLFISETDSEYISSPSSNASFNAGPTLNCGRGNSLAVLSGHVGSVSCLALCGEFVLSASQGTDIRVWQQPDLRQFAKFGHGDGSVKALVAAGNRVFTAHQDSRIRVWKVSRSSENAFRLIATMPTTRDYLGKFMKQSNYVQTRRHHRRLWIEHADSISCLAVSNGFIYSGSWDKTLKIWRISDLKCLESIVAHDDAINAVVAHRGLVYSASADGKVKVWNKNNASSFSWKHCLWSLLEGHKDVSLNSIVVCEDGRLVYGGESDGYVMGWEGDAECQKWKLVCEVRAHAMAVLCLCSVGEFLCSGSADKSIRVWKREIGGGLSNLRVICGHEGPVKCLQASSPSVGGGFILYSGSLDKSLRVWWVPKDCDAENENDPYTIYKKDQKERHVIAVPV